ncbi:protein FAR1-RELATED SEQUENCE 5 [Lolium perenne]|uniref:protein FAR1-RELATED SEQUENCE 5 n=1 Tax=Lolium perenne TaxID=4522 RepID=UPI003A991702
MSGLVPNPPAHGPTPAAVPGPDCDPSARQLPVTPGRVPGAVVNQPPSTVPRAVGEPSAHEPPSDTTSAHTVTAQGVQTNHAPKVGMSFRTEKEAYEFYSSYARNVGFSFRKGHSKSRADGTLCSKYYVCSNEGQPVASVAKPGRKQRPSTRSDCKARVQFNVSREGVWTVQKALLDHNHLLASPDMLHMSRSQRRIAESDRQILNQMRREGITAADIQQVLQQWSGGGENVNLLNKGSENQYLEPNYAQSLLEYLKNKQVDNPSFFYAVQLNDDGRIANFFWTDGQAIVDYACFGDAVSFDTTFERSRFEMPFAPFVGTNHHKKTIIFGAALLYDETLESFLWLFQTFLTAMSGKQPATILTDQSDEISKAIRSVFPNSAHRIGLHQICHGASKNVNHAICNHPQFLSDFKGCVYEQRSIASFDLKWKEMLSTYNLEGNAWMKNLYASRENWAAVYCHDSFYADMMSTQSNKGRNSTFEKFRRKLCLPEFLEEYEKCITSLRHNELEEDYKSRRTNPVPYFHDLPMLKTAAVSYTRNLYSDFEEEFKKSLTQNCTLLSQDGTISTYKFMPANCEGEAYAVFNSDDVTISCSCKMYERTGILCKHALRVFNLSNVFELPSHYIFKRWTKQAKAGLFCCRASDQSGAESVMSRCARISQKVHSAALRSSMSDDALQLLESGVDRLLWEVENSSSSTSLDGNDIREALES